MRCQNCKEKVARFPLKDSNGKIIWINLFKMDLMSIVGFVVIILMLVTYKADISKCEEMITDPLGYCEESNACKVLEERKEANPYGTVNIESISELNIS
ncbi:unnamed protein product [marine sediment metagenome]|uniref:Uncharacterized protein n=1 Tax=marine sediment metagenome TaxID=412755 RepID=X1BYI2_9ZZZZ